LPVDLITLSAISKSLISCSEEMGIVLKKSAYSSNIKERLDFSCAIFDGKGELISQAEHIPVHLGAMFTAMESILETYPEELFHPGDVLALNSPYEGGTHLPDITASMPVFINNEIKFFVMNRAHHSDVGGSVPGSMPGISREIYEEGLIIPPVKLYQEGRENKEIMRLILANVRTPKERLGDFRAQRAALLKGRERIEELCYKYGVKTVIEATSELMDISEKVLAEEIRKIPDGTYTFEDFLDSNGFDDKPVKIQVEIQKKISELLFSFRGTAKQQKANCNAPRSVTHSAVFYVIRCLTDPAVPTNAGLFRNIRITIPKSSILDPYYPAAVSSGNVETSQRIVDVILGALAQANDFIPAASQGTMNNVSIGGTDEQGKPFAYYETIGGGCGATKAYCGADGIHTHMTNTMNTPIEALELTFPLRVNHYAFRPNSGGKGRWKGGSGLVREIEVLVDCTASIQSERRKIPPYGLKGGQPGQKGLNILVRGDTGSRVLLSGRTIVELEAGDRIIIETPGGGGYGEE